VSNNPDDGTDVTIQDAINNLPAGGDIYVKPGVYVIPAALTSQPGPITIRGSGIGSTILDFGGVAGKFISVEHDAPVNLMDVTVLAGGLPGQHLYDVSSVYTGSNIFIIENVFIGDFNDTSKAIEGVIVGPMFGQLTNVYALLQTTTASYFADSTVATLGFCFLLCSNVTGIGQGPERLKWGGFKNRAGIVADMGSIFGVANFGDLGFLESEGGGTSFVGGGGTSSLTLPRFTVAGDGTFFNDVILVLETGEICLSGVETGPIYSAVVRSVDIPDGVSYVRITSCSFTGWTSETIRNGGQHVIFKSPLTVSGIPTVLEIGNADFNQYDGIGDAGSTIIGPSSIINGVLRKDVRASVTTDVFVAVVDHRNQKGVIGIGTVKNTGGVNSMDVRETVTDAFGVTASVTSVVAPGADLLLNPEVNKGAARPSYVSYMVEVRSTVAGTPTTYDLSHSTEGAML
jgi:hypothetical protein